MADHSKIEWTTATWNPVSGCRKVSAGCDNCYAIKDAHRLAGNPHPKVAAPYTAVTATINGRLNWTGIFHELPERLDQPLRWTKPRRIFVNSISDLFGEGISEAFIGRVFLTMAHARQHQFQVLTKRPDRMRAILNAPEIQEYVLGFLIGSAKRWPLPNVWLGTSVEDQKAADARAPALLETPAAVRFLSVEPLLGPVDLRHIQDAGTVEIDALTGDHRVNRPLQGRSPSRIDWVIVGGETGPAARPSEWRWYEQLVQQTREAGIPLFIKQLGSAGHFRHPKGGDMSEWPEALRAREHPR